MKSSSGVNASGPLMKRLISVVRRAGISSNAPSAIGSNRSHALHPSYALSNYNNSGCSAAIVSPALIVPPSITSA